MKYFEKQIEKTEQLTQEQIDELVGKTDKFDTKLLPGDRVVFGLFYHKNAESDSTEFGTSLIANIEKISSSSFNLIEQDYMYGGMTGTDGILPRFYYIPDFTDEELEAIRKTVND